MIYELKDLLCNIDMNSNTSSSVLDIRNINGFCLQHLWSAGSVNRVANVSVQAATKPQNGFSQIDTFSINGSSGDRLVVYSSVYYGYIMVSYNVSSMGGGTLTTTLSGKS